MSMLKVSYSDDHKMALAILEKIFDTFDNVKIRYHVVDSVYRRIKKACFLVEELISSVS